MDRILKNIEDSNWDSHEFVVLQGFDETLDTSDYNWIFSMYFEVFNGISNLKTEYFYYG